MQTTYLKLTLRAKHLSDKSVFSLSCFRYLCRRFTKLTGPCAYTLHSNPIPQQIVAYISQTGHQCFLVCFCHPTVRNFDISPKEKKFSLGPKKGAGVIIFGSVFLLWRESQITSYFPHRRQSNLGPAFPLLMSVAQRPIR